MVEKKFQLYWPKIAEIKDGETSKRRKQLAAP